MNFKTFTSRNNWFSIRLPIDWEEYDDGEEDTYAFFNAKSWTGNFRITPFRWTKVLDPTKDKAQQFIEEELTENKGAIKMKLGYFDCVHYKKNITQGEEKLIIYYWATGKRNNLFICSFTIDKKQERTKTNKLELQTVEDIIRSIRIT